MLCNIAQSGSSNSSQGKFRFLYAENKQWNSTNINYSLRQFYTPQIKIKTNHTFIMTSNISKSPSSRFLDARIKFFQACDQCSECSRIDDRSGQFRGMFSDSAQDKGSSLFIESLIQKVSYITYIYQYVLFIE